VYSLQQGRRDVETVFTMGIMEDVNLVPQPAGGEDWRFLFDMLNVVKYIYFVLYVLSSLVEKYFPI
jgi:outer membrane protein insertion porin family